MAGVQDEELLAASGFDGESGVAEGCGEGEAESVAEPWHVLSVAGPAAAGPASPGADADADAGKLLGHPADHHAARVPHHVHTLVPRSRSDEPGFGEDSAHCAQELAV
ncbi:hypothetical protein BCL76_11581 [Streptomyces sp. CG 926]|uniref:hypothetical protein n=1 Tax=Streptomyces sp. CG 926 TaxID=1882405 RepID=UPI000D6A9F33|nr:hypothetical protein [Streptomyces sp. CG 926]PWK64437.1 hypothetical protein BCL76_11581 [Streptomyces sp. CG 926]